MNAPPPSQPSDSLVGGEGESFCDDFGAKGERKRGGRKMGWTVVHEEGSVLEV